MKKLFVVALVASFLSVAASSFAGVDYIQYRDDFKSQENSGKQYQHKSKEARDEMNKQTDKAKNLKKEGDALRNTPSNTYHKTVNPF